MLIAFVLGSAGTALGVLLALNLINAPEVFGENYKAVAGMMTVPTREVAQTSMQWPYTMM